MKQIIRLTENDLHRIVEEVISELGPKYTNMLPYVGHRREVRGQSDEDVKKHAKDNGMSSFEYTKGKIKASDEDPEGTAKIVRRRVQQNKEKNKKGA